MLRSCPVSLIQIYVPSEAAKLTVAMLGELGVIQFKDLNESVPPFQRLYSKDIIKLEKMELKIRALCNAAAAYNFADSSSPPLSLEDADIPSAISTYNLDEMSHRLDEFQHRIKRLQDNQRSLTDQLITAKIDHPESALLLENSDEETSIGMGDDSRENADSQLQYLIGVIERRKLVAFERVLWRALRGNVYMNSSEICEPVLQDSATLKNAFIVFCPGRESLAKAKRICQALGCQLYDIDQQPHRREQLFNEATSRIDDINSVLFNTRQAVIAELSRILQLIKPWLYIIRREKHVYAALNMFNYDVGRKGLIAEAWSPTSQISNIYAALLELQGSTGLQVSSVLSILETSAMPPTFFLTTKLTAAFQNMTDVYAIASYQEANPAVFMLFSFPFFFAVMFGDIGHALLMGLFASVLVLFEKRLAYLQHDEIGDMIYSGRYVILLMALFSIFAGIIYNDIFSRSFSIFPSAYELVGSGATQVRSSSYTYPLGIDPLWNHASNGLLFVNSYKMKQAIIMGVIHMSLGICVGMSNSIFKRDRKTLLGQQLPQLIFLLALFGYLCFLILLKWIVGFDVSLLNVFINMILQFGSVEGPLLYFGQVFVQRCLVFLAFACIPWMLLYNPISVFLERRRIQRRGYNITRRESGDSITTTTDSKPGVVDDNIGDVVVHQMIHTIEFVLGSVSNTASYLRLWALSLAHAQLSDVLWKMVLENTIASPIGAAFGFLVWFIFTIALMVMMEGMSAFLHALRLHWVEFNNKFFEGGGTKFEPFSLSLDALLSER